jgi:hypothetical protein
VQFAAGLPRRNCTKIKKRPKKNIKVIGINKAAGKRSEVPFSRREEGRELGEEKEKKGRKRKKNRTKGKRKRGRCISKLICNVLFLIS